MRNVIQQSIVLPATAEALFDMYLDPAAHAAITGSPVAISPEQGADFRAFEGQLTGRIEAVARPRLIVQSWRSVKFYDDDLDSTLILAFSSEDFAAPTARIDLVHVDVPDHDFQDVIEGWQKYYWTPWEEYLRRRGAAGVGKSTH